MHLPMNTTAGIDIRRIVRKAALGVAAAGVLTVGTTGPAAAHAELVSVGPPADRLLLSFSEPVELAFSRVTILDGAGAEVPQRQPLSLLEGDGKVVVVELAAPLPAGTYKLQWSIVSADGHKVEGTTDYEAGAAASGQ